MYTQFCRELASAGAIVIAIEHEDGSGLFAKNASTGEIITYVNNPDDLDKDDSKALAAFRHPFLEKRADELTATVASVAAAAERRDVCKVQSSEEALCQRFYSVGILTILSLWGTPSVPQVLSATCGT